MLSTVLGDKEVNNDVLSFCGENYSAFLKMSTYSVLHLSSVTVSQRAFPLQSRRCTQHWAPTQGSGNAYEIGESYNFCRGRTTEPNACIEPMRKERPRERKGLIWSHPQWPISSVLSGLGLVRVAAQACFRKWLDVLSSQESLGRPERMVVTWPMGPLESSRIWSNVSCRGFVPSPVFAYVITTRLKLTHCFVKCFGISQV